MKDMKTDFNVRVSISSRELNGSAGYDIIVAVGNIKEERYSRPDEDIPTKIGRLVTECFMGVSTLSLIRINNMKAFD